VIRLCDRFRIPDCVTPMPIPFSYRITVSLLVTCLAAAAEEPSPVFPLQAEQIQSYLFEHSNIVDASRDGDDRHVISTELEPFDDEKQFLLVYRRTSYQEPGHDADWVESRQVIHYTVPVSDVDLTKVRLSDMEARTGDASFWLVLADVRDDAPPIPYTNITDSRSISGAKNVVTSSSEVRGMALGYFTTRELAQEFMTRFRAWIESLTDMPPAR